jgi:hypothetical protein
MPRPRPKRIRSRQKKAGDTPNCLIARLLLLLAGVIIPKVKIAESFVRSLILPVGRPEAIKSNLRQ